MAKNNGDIPAAERGERGKQLKNSDSDLELARSATSDGMTAPQIINRYQNCGERLRAVRRRAEKNRSNRVVNATAILGIMEKKTNPLSLRSIWFSDEKVFTAAPKRQGTRDDRALIPSNVRKGDVSASVIMKGVTAHPVSLMVGRRVSSQGRIQPHFAPKGVYINGDYYWEQIKLAAGDEHFLLQQDQAKPRYTPENQAWLNRHMKGWLKPWMNKGAYLNPLDYGIWSQVQEKVWADKSATLINLRASALKHLIEFPTEGIRNSIRTFPKRLRMRIQENGGYFEQKLKRKN